MISFVIDISSSALKALGRLSAINPANIHNNLAPEMEVQAKKSYQKAWAHMKDMPVTNLYRAVKLATLGHTKRGKLTGSSFLAIKSRASKQMVEAGFLSDSGRWPALSGDKKAPIKDLLNYLDKKHNNYGNKNVIPSLGYVQLKYGPLSGLDIIWPQWVKDKYGIRDIHKGPERFASKHYYGNKQTRFFLMSPGFINGEVMPIVGEYIDSIINPARRSSALTAPEPIKDKDIAETYKEFTEYKPTGGGTRAPVGEYQFESPVRELDDSLKISQEQTFSNVRAELVDVIKKMKVSKQVIDNAIQNALKMTEYQTRQLLAKFKMESGG